MIEINQKLLREVIKSRRQALSMSQLTLAEAIGVGRIHLNRIEAGQKKITADILVRLSVILNFDIREVARGYALVKTKARTHFRGNTLECPGCNESESFAKKLPMGVKEIVLFTEWFNERHSGCMIEHTISAQSEGET